MVHRFTYLKGFEHKTFVWFLWQSSIILLTQIVRETFYNRPFARYGRNLSTRCILGNKKKFWVTLGANKPIGTAILQWKRKVLVVSRLLLVNSLVLLSLNMGKSDHCTVYGCNNDRRYPQRYVIKDHISKTFACDTLKFGLLLLSL